MEVISHEDRRPKTQTVPLAGGTTKPNALRLLRSAVSEWKRLLRVTPLNVAAQVAKSECTVEPSEKGKILVDKPMLILAC